MEATALVNERTWRKATYSGGASGACVETAEASHGAVAVRDTTNREGFTLMVPGGAWHGLTAAIKSGPVGL